MPELRWILIALGVVLLVGIYVWGLRTTRRPVAAADDLAGRTGPDAQSFAAHAPAERFVIDEGIAPPAEGADSPAESGRSDGFAAAALAARAPARDIPQRATSDVAYEVARPDIRRSRVEPTLSDGATDEIPDGQHVSDETPVEETAEPSRPAAQSAAPTLSMSSAPSPRRVERRKILALRLAAGAQKFPGERLLQALQAESLDHGKYDVFHRLHADGASIFSVASMVEPGTFDLEQMPATFYAGLTLFAQLPGPVAGIEALEELIACGKRLQEKLGGTLQDERGIALTSHRVDRLRQEAREFRGASGSDAADGGASGARS